MLIDVTKIALLCLIMGVASIPLSFNINTSPVVVWFGNALGSLVSALVVIYIFNHLDSRSSYFSIRKTRLGRKIVGLIDSGSGNKKVKQAGGFINHHGLKVFSLFAPLFPGVLISTTAVYLLGLNKKTYIRWMCTGVVIISGIYVLGYWWLFVK